jgi:hypothetical protein
MEIILKVGLGVLCVAMVWFIWAAYRAIKISIQKRADEINEWRKKLKPENTRLICDFMGYKIWKPWIAKFKPFEHEMVTTPFGIVEFDIMDEKFRTDWGWLHEITNKIGKIPFSEKDGMREWMSIEWSDSEINIYSTKKEVYDKIVKFIKWYND